MPARLGRQESLQPGVAGGLVVQPRRAEKLVFGTRECRRGEVVGHQVRAQHVDDVDPGPLGHEAEERTRSGADAPHGVDVALRIQRDRLAVLGQMDCQLRHAQDRLVDADEPVIDGGPGPHGQPAADAEVAVQPRVQPRPAVGLQRHHLPARHEPVGVLFDAQVRAVGVAADDAKRSTGSAVFQATRARALQGDQLEPARGGEIRRPRRIAAAASRHLPTVPGTPRHAAGQQRSRRRGTVTATRR